ncbi:hypothetical protein K7432_005085 [Basidiobolus ranarum]|uniref:Uncharacterized protein n=1 Tax=Basidiobolus ranarum TaxID=34480 RepID=A0ABR2WX38_9FUNG
MDIMQWLKRVQEISDKLGFHAQEFLRSQLTCPSPLSANVYCEEGRRLRLVVITHGRLLELKAFEGSLVCIPHQLRRRCVFLAWILVPDWHKIIILSIYA